MQVHQYRSRSSRFMIIVFWPSISYPCQNIDKLNVLFYYCLYVYNFGCRPRLGKGELTFSAFLISIIVFHQYRRYTWICANNNVICLISKYHRLCFNRLNYGTHLSKRSNCGGLVSKLVHFVIHGRHISMEWMIPKCKFSKQMIKKYLFTEYLLITEGEFLF